jgi:GTP:adenosylcobinamide-phosphate guanylyltransferase
VIAAITAGGRVEGRLAEAIGTDVKALAPLAGGKLVDRAIEAAREAGARRIAVIGGAQIREHCAGRVDEVIAELADGRENIRLAIEAGRDEPLLLMTSDLPFISGEATRDFIARAAGSDLALPLANERAYTKAYPGAPDHITQIGSERVANGSIVYFAPGIAPRVLDVSQSLFDARKSLVRMAMLLGPVLLLRFIARRLEIAHVERRANDILGVRAVAVRDASPTLCYDIDTIEDYRYALEHLAHG